MAASFTQAYAGESSTLLCHVVAHSFSLQNRSASDELAGGYLGICVRGRAIGNNVVTEVLIHVPVNKGAACPGKPLSP